MAKENKASKLGVMSKIDSNYLREIWPDEAKDFTPWLAKEANLKLLGDAVGIDMILEEREAAVGAFSLDLLAKEDGGDERRIVIENQLQNTNHDHLGKLITYASGRDANVVIWIVKGARDEHRKAIQWLNQHTDDTLAFFLIEIELWRIGDSPIAPKFSVVEQPNAWAKTIKEGGEKSATKLLQMDFWNAFRDAAKLDPAFMDVFSLQKADSRPYYVLRIGFSNCQINLRAIANDGTISTEFYVRRDKALYNKLKGVADTIHQELGEVLTWYESKQDSRIILTRQGDITDRDSWPEMFAWFREQALKMRPVFRKLVTQ